MLGERYGTRSMGMGETGYALADDESVLFFNPAGLGIANYRWDGGTAGASRETIKDDSYDVNSNQDNGIKSSYSLIYQNDHLKNSGFGANVYRQGLGTLAETDALGDTLGEVNLYEMAVALGGGYTLFPDRPVSHSFGVTVKYYHKADYEIDHAESPSLARRLSGADPWQTVSFDAGYILNLFKCLRLGLVIKNMGPGVSINGNNYRDNFGQPLSFAAGIGFKNDFGNRKITVLDLANEISFSRSRCTNKFDETFTIGTNSQTTESFENHTIYSDVERTFATGVELLFLRTIALRLGYDYFRLISDQNSVYKGISWSYNEKYNSWKMCVGLGLRLFNHFEADVFASQSQNDAENVNLVNKTGFSFAFTRALNWSKADLKWWRRDNRGK